MFGGQGESAVQQCPTGLLISGGSGITPVLSMLRTLALEDHAGEVAFLDYTRSPEVVPYRAELGTRAAARQLPYRTALSAARTPAGARR